MLAICKTDVGSVDKNNIGEILANYNLAVLTLTAKPPNLIPRQISGYMVCEVTMQRPHFCNYSLESVYIQAVK